MVLLPYVFLISIYNVIVVLSLIKSIQSIMSMSTNNEMSKSIHKQCPN